MNILGSGLGCLLIAAVYGLCAVLVLYGFTQFFLTDNIWWVIGTILLATFILGVGFASGKVLSRRGISGLLRRRPRRRRRGRRRRNKKGYKS